MPQNKTTETASSHEELPCHEKIRNQPTENSSSHEGAICHERIRQARLSFNLALYSTAIGVIVTLSGPVLLWFGNPSAGAITTGVGGAASTLCWKLTKDANDRLDKLAQGLKEDD